MGIEDDERRIRGGRMNERREMLNGQRTALIRKSPSLGRWMFKEEVEGKDAGRAVSGSTK